MKRLAIIITFISLVSCNKDVKPIIVQDTTTHTIYGYLHEENSFLISLLEQQIDTTLNSEALIKNKEAQRYDSITQEYLKYVDKVYNELLNKINIEERADYNGILSNIETATNFFFTNDDYNQNAIEYTTKMNTYNEQIVALVKDENLKDRFGAIIVAKDVMNREGKKIKYLNYYYKNMPLIAVLSHIRNKKRNVLEFENEFLKNLLIKN